MNTVPLPTEVAGYYLMTGPPVCPGHLYFTVTVENLDLDRLLKQPDLLELLKETIKESLLRHPRGYNESEVNEKLVVLRDGNKSSSLHHRYTAENVKLRHQKHPYNMSIEAHVAIFSQRGISFASAQITTSNRFDIAQRVTQDLGRIQSQLHPVMAPGSEIFVSAVSPIIAKGHGAFSTIAEAESVSAKSRGMLQGDVVSTRTMGPGSVAVCLFVPTIGIGLLAVLLRKKSEGWRRQTLHLADGETPHFANYYYDSFLENRVRTPRSFTRMLME